MDQSTIPANWQKYQWGLLGAHRTRVGHSGRVSGEVREVRSAMRDLALPEYLHGGNNAVEIRPDRDARQLAELLGEPSSLVCYRSY